MKANVARAAAPKTAPMATSANAPGASSALGIRRLMPVAKMPPSAALAMNIGASKPPDVPEPSEITSASDLKTAISSRSFQVRLLLRMAEMVSYPTPSTRGTK